MLRGVFAVAGDALRWVKEAAALVIAHGVDAESGGGSQGVDAVGGGLGGHRLSIGVVTLKVNALCFVGWFAFGLRT